MASVEQLLLLVDEGFSPEFAASLAGLSLAAATFFASVSKKTIEEASRQLEALEKTVSDGERRGIPPELMEIHTEKIERLNKKIDDAKTSQKGLIKAFLIFVFFVVHAISLDQIISGETVGSFSGFLGYAAGLPILYVDVFISITLLTWAGKNLWQGARAIGSSFDVDFKDEMSKIEEIKKALGSIR